MSVFRGIPVHRQGALPAGGPWTEGWNRIPAAGASSLLPGIPTAGSAANSSRPPTGKSSEAQSARRHPCSNPVRSQPFQSSRTCGERPIPCTLVREAVTVHAVSSSTGAASLKMQLGVSPDAIVVDPVRHVAGHESLSSHPQKIPVGSRRTSAKSAANRLAGRVRS